ncbi:protein of unknown function [Burkholderia multivorans]
MPSSGIQLHPQNVTVFLTGYGRFLRFVYRHDPRIWLFCTPITGCLPRQHWLCADSPQRRNAGILQLGPRTYDGSKPLKTW